MTRFHDTLSFQETILKIERFTQQRISHQANVSAICFEHISECYYHVKISHTRAKHVT